MSFSDFLSERELAFKEEARAFVAETIAPRAAEIDANDEVPEEIFRALHRYLLLTVPRDFGGEGLSEIFACLAVEAVGYACPALVPYLEVGQLFAKAIELGGSDEQKRRFLSRLAKGELGAYMLTDAGAGSDPARMETTAKRERGAWRIDGRKRHITFFERASMAVVFARTGGAGELSAFVVEKPFDAIEVERRSEWTGLRGHTAWNLTLRGLESRELIGNPHGGLKLALEVLNHTRISLACGHAGLARAALDLAIRFAKEREVGGQKLAEKQAIAFPIVETLARVEAARLLAYRAAKMAEHGEKHRAETAMAKLVAAETLIEAVTVANRTLGGFGGHLDFPAERHLRDAFSWVAAQGTSEVQKMTIAREVFA